MSNPRLPVSEIVAGAVGAAITAILISSCGSSTAPSTATMSASSSVQTLHVPFTIPGGGEHTDVAICPAGTQAISGGWAGLPSTMSVIGSHLVDGETDTWQFDVYNTGAAAQVELYVTCLGG